jgi:hypothetical protein
MRFEPLFPTLGRNIQTLKITTGLIKFIVMKKIKKKFA